MQKYGKAKFWSQWHFKQWLLFYKMLTAHEYWFYVWHCWVVLHYKGLGEDFLVLFLFLSEGLVSVFKSNF